MRLGRVNDVVPVIEPARDQGLDHVRRVLAVAIHEKHGAEPRVIETGEKRGLLAEIARQRDDLNIERQRRQAIGYITGAVVAPVVDVNNFKVQPALVLQEARNLRNAFMQDGQAFGLVEQGHDNRHRRRR